MQTDKLLHRELTCLRATHRQAYKFIGIFYKVHTTLSCGFPEKIYQRAIEMELKKENISYFTEKDFKVEYEGKEIGHFRLDMAVDEKVVIELKAVDRLPKVFREQLIFQLKASPYELGLLVNFGAPKLEYTRIVRSKSV